MNLAELFILAIGLSMDAFAVSVCKGMTVPTVRLRHAGTAGLYFGGFQALMPALGYLLGGQFQTAIARFDHWIAFILLGLIGLSMLKESCGEKQEELSSSFGFGAMLPLAVATSIDALAVGVTFAFLQVQIVPAVLFIGVTTFLLSALGVKIGNIFGLRFKAGAERVGGVVLICMGVKILLEHLGILPF